MSKRSEHKINRFIFAGAVGGNLAAGVLLTASCGIDNITSNFSIFCSRIFGLKTSFGTHFNDTGVSFLYGALLGFAVFSIPLAISFVALRKMRKLEKEIQKETIHYTRVDEEDPTHSFSAVPN